MNSTANMNTFVHDLVAMAKATEELPIIKEALQNETEHANRLASTVQERELSIMDLKAQVEALNAKLRETEVQRDDAEYRFLESEDKAHRVLDLVRGVQTALGETVVTLDPPKPEPEPIPEPVSVQVDPTVVHVDPIGTGTESVPSGYDHTTPLPEGVQWENPTTPLETTPSTVADGGGGSVTTQDATSQGSQSEVDPTTAPTPTSPSSPPEDSSVVTVESTSTESPYANEPPRDNEGAWQQWAFEMDAKYGPGNWPVRAT